MRFLLQDSYCRDLHRTLQESVASWANSVDTLEPCNAEGGFGGVLIATPPAGSAMPKAEYAALIAAFPTRVLWLDWNHLQYPEDLASALESEWHLVLSCVPAQKTADVLPPALLKRALVLSESPVLQRLVRHFRSFLSNEALPAQPVFISQPLSEDRGPPLDQLRLFERAREKLIHRFSAPWIVLQHPREPADRWRERRNALLQQLASLQPSPGCRPVFFGYNTLPLLAAQLAGLETRSLRLEGWPPNEFGLPETVVGPC